MGKPLPGTSTVTSRGFTRRSAGKAARFWLGAKPAGRDGGQSVRAGDRGHGRSAARRVPQVLRRKRPDR